MKNQGKSMDKIIISDLKLFAHHGVNEDEKIYGQNFIIDAELYANLGAACESDDLNETVNYAKVVKTIRRVFTAEKYDLIERAAQVVCDAVLEEFERVEKIRLTLKKPEAPIKADFGYVAVCIERERA